MVATITGFAASPDRGRGLARDMRVRWILEELGVPFQMQLLSFAEMKQPAHLARHPFGQIPTYQEGDLTLFESGAILLHLAERHPGLLPTDGNARMRAITWLFAALNTIEPPVIERSMVIFHEADEDWYERRLPLLDKRVRQRLGQLSAYLGDAQWLDGDFSIADLMMVTVLMRMEGLGLVAEYPNLAAYVARAKARPAFQRAFEAQRQVFLDAQAAAQPATP